MRIKLATGSPYPFGFSNTCKGANFTLHAPYALKIFLHLFDNQRNLLEKIALSPIKNRTGDIWHIEIESDLTSFIYGWEVINQKYIPLLNETFPHLLLDPFCKRVFSSYEWNSGSYEPLSYYKKEIPFDWGDEKPPKILPKDLIIYEMHVRGMTKDRSSRVVNPGTFLGLKEKISYLKNLGVNALELLPIFEFNEQEYKKENLFNYWGYSTVSFGAPNNRYGSSNVELELKELVKEAHLNGIEIILDVVFNHTAEGGETGPIYSFKGLDPSIYYQTNSLMEWQDFSGCGNTLNANHPIVHEWIIAMLRHWVIEYHIDGFRFDLASIFYRGENGKVLSQPPIVEAIAKDPILRETKLIAEAWDAAGLYQVGSFYPTKRWKEWNGSWRDIVRRFIKGNSGEKGNFATKITGSQDLFHQKTPIASINFVTCHDGFTLCDLVSYNEKHNLANGEENRDGYNYNDSWNCGAEGETSDPEIQFLRMKQMKNFLTALFISQGIPMLLSGDEYGHTKKGNNNTWCQDNELNWFLWDKLEQENGLFRFTKGMIGLRKQFPHFKKGHFLTDADITWWGTSSDKPQWNLENHFVAFLLKDEKDPLSFYIAFNASNKKIAITIPKTEQTWEWIVNTSAKPPLDYFDVGTGPLLIAHSYTLPPYSAIILKELPKV